MEYGEFMKTTAHWEDQSLESEFCRTITQIVEGTPKIDNDSWKDEYLVWNQYIAKYFFNETMASKDVILYINEDLIEQIGVTFNGNLLNFINSIRNGLMKSGAGLWAKVKRYAVIDSNNNIGWREKEFPSFPGKYLFPPYIGFLAFFVLAGGKEGDYSQLVYYKRLWDLLGIENRSDNYPSFERMDDLWRDLENWCNIDEEEELGRFILREPYIAHWIHVGLPLTQLIISEDERKKLQIVFFRGRLDPLDPPPVEVIHDIFIRYGSIYLTARTQSILNSNKAEILPFQDLLLDLILTELSDWDGSLPDISDQRLKSKSRKKRYLPESLRICLNFGHPKKSYLRLKTKKEFPDDGFEFKYLGPDQGLLDKNFICNETSGSIGREEGVTWSKPLILSGSKQSDYFEAHRLDWTRNQKLKDENYRLAIRLQKKEVRLFKRGQTESLDGWIETNKLVRNRDLLIACKRELKDEIEKWGRNACESFQERDFSGLPKDWCLFKLFNAFESYSDNYLLTLSKKLRLNIIGGIRVRKGNSFLSFAPPSFQVDAMTDNEGVICFVDGSLTPIILDYSTDESVLSFPKELERECKLKIELWDRNKKVLLGKRNITLIEPDFDPDYSFEHDARFDCHGKLIPNSQKSDHSFIQGNIVHGKIHEKYELPKLPVNALSRRFILIGSNIGEVFFSKGSLTTDLIIPWNVVWIISKIARDKWKVHSTGLRLKPNDVYQREIPSQFSPQMRKKWMNAILHTSGLVLPQLHELRLLWKDYVFTANSIRSRSWRD